MVTLSEDKGFRLLEIPLLLWDYAQEAALWIGAELFQSSKCTRRLVFIHSISAMAAKLVYADGKMCESELEVLHKYMDYDYAFRRSATQRSRVRRSFYAALDSEKTFRDYAREVSEVFEEHRGLSMNILKVLFELVGADGVIDYREEQMLKDAVCIFGFDGELFEFLYSTYFGESDDAESRFEGVKKDSGQQKSEERSVRRYYSILECKEGCSKGELKKSYRRLAQEYHPDKINALGLPSGFTEFANRKFQEINDAYQVVSRELRT